MSTLIIPNNIANGNSADGNQVDANFDAIAAWANANAVHKDGSVAMTGLLTLSGNPAGVLQAAPKQYVDGTWVAHTPTIDQGVTTNIAKTVAYSKYRRIGTSVTWNFSLTLAGAGTAGSNVLLQLPVAAATATAVGAGSGWALDLSAATRYGGAWTNVSTTQIAFVGDWAGALAWGSSPSIALASGDLLSGCVEYEV